MCWVRSFCCLFIQPKFPEPRLLSCFNSGKISVFTILLSIIFPIFFYHPLRYQLDIYYTSSLELSYLTLLFFKCLVFWAKSQVIFSICLWVNNFALQLCWVFYSVLWILISTTFSFKDILIFFSYLFGFLFLTHTSKYPSYFSSILNID